MKSDKRSRNAHMASRGKPQSSCQRTSTSATDAVAAVPGAEGDCSTMDAHAPYNLHKHDMHRQRRQRSQPTGEPTGTIGRHVN